ncbi:MAG: M15 family metallopeptidase [Cyanobacteria bacterium P01_F01_bin.42]
MTSPRPYWHVPICDNQEALVPIPLQDFAAAPSHDYQSLGAPYGDLSPYAVRSGVLDALYQAQAHLQAQYPSWRVYIFDAYRPVSVQQFMANHAYQSLVTEKNLDKDALDAQTQSALWQEVYTIWAPPSNNPLTPPPHSTGAAVDVTLFNLKTESCVNMGSPIDELSERSQPEHFAQMLAQGNLEGTDLEAVKEAVKNRNHLAEAMLSAGFQRHRGEWWHFCLGDQMWAWLLEEQTTERQVAHYGRYDLLAQE